MAAWAYACRPCGGEETIWYVPQTAVDEMPAEVRIVRVQVGSDWLCASSIAPFASAWTQCSCGR